MRYDGKDYELVANNDEYVLLRDTSGRLFVVAAQDIELSTPEQETAQTKRKIKKA